MGIQDGMKLMLTISYGRKGKEIHHLQGTSSDIKENHALPGKTWAIADFPEVSTSLCTIKESFSDGALRE